MKKQFLFIFSLVLISTIQMFSQTPSYMPQDGLVGWWPFNGNANDESGNNNHGTVHGASLINDRQGNSNKAYHFDMYQENFISVDNHQSLVLTDEISISAWFKISTFNCEGAILGMGMSTPSGTGYNLLATSGCFNQYTSFGRRNPNLFQNHAVMTDETYTNDTWTHVVATYDGVDMKIYINGEFINAVEHIFSLDGLDDPLFFGKELLYFPVERYFNGDIDDIGIWNRALSDDEISKLFLSREDTTTTVNSVEQKPNIVQGNVLLYPNPAVTNVNIDFNEFTDYKGKTLKIMNMSGQIVYEENITQSKMTLSVVDRFSKGIYIVTTTDSGGNILSNQKLVVQ